MPDASILTIIPQTELRVKIHRALEESKVKCANP